MTSPMPEHTSAELRATLALAVAEIIAKETGSCGEFLANSVADAALALLPQSPPGDQPSLLTEARAREVLAMLRGWSDSDFAVACAGEYCEDIKGKLEGTIASLLDARENPSPASGDASRSRLADAILPSENDRVMLPSGAYLEGEGATEYLKLVRAVSDALDRAEAEVASMRERCAQVADEYPKRDPGNYATAYQTAEEIAIAIRALSSPTPDGMVLVPADEWAAVKRIEADAVSGLRYIEQHYGRLAGVGWDRVFDAHDALCALAENRKAAALEATPASDGGALK